MSQIASFYLLKDGRRQELSNGNCSGEIYIAIWDWCESELDMDVRFPAPQTDNTLDCVLLEGSWQRYCWRRWRSRGYRSWPPRSPRTGICPPRWCRVGWKRCAPIWNRCKVIPFCCMR